MSECTSTTTITILYYTFTILNEIWDGPLGKAFREWFAKTNTLPAGPKKIALLNIQ